MEKKTVWNSKAYWLPVLAAVALAYPIFLTTYTVGVDDLRVSFVDDGIPHGRLTNFITNKLLFPSKFIPQPFTNVIGLLLVILGCTLLCAFWQKAMGENSLHAGQLGMFTALFITYPMLIELLQYNMTAILMGEGILLVTAALENLYARDAGTEKKRFAVAVVCLAGAISAYETTAPLYICLTVATFWLEWEFLQPKTTQVSYWLKRSIPYILALAAGIAVEGVVTNAVTFLLTGGPVTGNGANNLGWDFHDIGGTVARLAEDTALSYAVFALEYLPVGIMWVAIIACLIWSVYQAKKEKIGLPIVFFLVFTLSIFLLGIISGKNMEYRVAAWPIAVYIAFTALQWLSGTNGKTVGKKIIFVCAAFLLLTQCREMTYRQQIDELRWQEERAVITGIGYKYESEFDTSKPLVFVGRHQLSNIIMDANYAHKDSFTMRMIARFFPENGMNERQYYCRRIVQMEGFPVITSALDTGNHLIDEIFKYCGYDITTGTPEMFEEAKPLRDTMPAWPAEGSMVDKGDYILVNLGEEFLGGF